MAGESNSRGGTTVNENTNSVRSNDTDNQVNDSTVERSSAVKVASKIVSNAILGAFGEIEWSHHSNLDQENSKLVC